VMSAVRGCGGFRPDAPQRRRLLPNPCIKAAHRFSVESLQHFLLGVAKIWAWWPDEMRQQMPDFGLYHYSLAFENTSGLFPPEPPGIRSVRCRCTTHDFCRLCALLEALYLELRRRLISIPVPKSQPMWSRARP